MTAYLVLQAATLIAVAFLCSGLRQLDRTQTRILELLQDLIDEAAESLPESSCSATNTHPARCRQFVGGGDLIRVRQCRYPAIKDGYCKSHARPEATA